MDDRLSQLDFSSLLTLKAVHDQGSFTRAAERLGQTQSNVSYTISRLRKLFDDPLFIRQGGQTQPTTFCLDLVAASTELLDQFESALAPQTFDSRKISATVTLSCNHYERITVLPNLIRYLRRSAPGVRLRAIAAGTRGDEQLKRGACDLVLGPLPVEGEGIFKRTLLTDQYVMVVDPSHPLARRPLNVEDLNGLPHLGIRFSNQWEPIYTRAFDAAGITLDTCFEIAEHGDIGGYVLGTDLATIVPLRVAQSLDPRLSVRSLPVEVTFSVDMMWSARTHRAALHQWLRDVIFKLEKAPHAQSGPETAELR